MTFCRIFLIFDEELCPKQVSIKNKSCKVLFLSFILIASDSASVLFVFYIIAGITNYMYAEFYEV